MSTSRPDRTTMEGMIWNANHVLERALDPKTMGIPKLLFQDAVGLILISVVEAGFIFSGSVGTGIILRKTRGVWSAPCACGLTGVGWGLLIGGSVKDVIVFIMDDVTLSACASKHGLKLGTQLEATLGPIGRSGNLDLTASGGGLGSTVAVAFSRGAFLGFNIEGAVVGARDAVNSLFYGQSDLSPRAILYDNAVKPPEGKVTLLEEVYDKLHKLAQGVTAEPDAAEEAKKVAAKAEADKAAAEANAHPDVVEVDAAAEAAKEG